MKATFYALLLGAALVTTACDSEKPQSNQTDNNLQVPKRLAVQAPIFSADTAYDFVAKQVAFGPRVPGSAAHQKCGNFLVQTLKNYGAEVTEQTFVTTAFDGKSLNGRNIIGSFNPSATRRIILAAHWDTRPFADQDPNQSLHKTPIDGANDGGSGVGILLEIARVLKNNPSLAVGIDIIFFDVEDYGEPAFAEDNIAPAPNGTYYCLGSQYWAQNKHKPGYSAYYGILLDMAGGKGTQFIKEGHSVQFAPKITDLVWAEAQKAGLGNLFLNQTGAPLIDDHYFVNQLGHIPMVDIIGDHLDHPNSFPTTWHTQNDKLENIDKDVLRGVGQTLLNVIYTEPGA